MRREERGQERVKGDKKRGGRGKGKKERETPKRGGNL